MGDLGSVAEKRSEVETLFGAPAEPQFDRITKLVQSHFGFDVALFTLLDDDRFWYKSRQGLSANGRDHAYSMCRHALERDDVLVFTQPDEPSPSPSADSDAPIWRSPQKTYVGRSIRAPSGDKIGTLCMTHGCKRALTSAELAEFDDFACLLEGALQNRIVSSTLAELASELDVARREALLDPLAQVWNRRGLDVVGGKLVAQARRNARPLAAAMIDIDRFKAINDALGHAQGDAVIMRLAASLRRVARQDDCVIRYGGEEFLLLASGLSTADLPAWGERIQRMIAAAADGPDFTVSIGLAAVDAEPYALDALISSADRALYAAKAGGRDRFMLAED